MTWGKEAQTAGLARRVRLALHACHAHGPWPQTLALPRRNGTLCRGGRPADAASISVTAACAYSAAAMSFSTMSLLGSRWVWGRAWACHPSALQQRQAPGLPRPAAAGPGRRRRAPLSARRKRAAAASSSVQGEDLCAPCMEWTVRRHERRHGPAGAGLEFWGPVGLAGTRRAGAALEPFPKRIKWF